MMKLNIRIPIIRTTIPPELDSKAVLFEYLGLNDGELKKIRWFRGTMYRQFSISKNSKKPRYINAPDKRLKFLQRKIANRLTVLYRVRNPVHGFVPNKSVKTNAEAHLRKRHILNLDIENFFPTITENRVTGLLESLGLKQEVAEAVSIICCWNGQLPQGAPSSPLLSNMVCFRMDKDLLAYAKEVHCIFTRYADDITFSSHQPMAKLFNGQVPSAGKFSPDLLTTEFKQIFSNNGFKINENKAHYADRHSRRMVTGIKVNELLNVDRRFVRNIRATLHSLETHGLDAAQKKFESKYSGRCSLEAFLRGKISWLSFIRGKSDPVFRALAIRFNSNFKNSPIEVTPTKEEVRDRAVWVVEHASDENMNQGTAFFLNEGFLVTAAHCVKDVIEVEIYHPSKRANKFKATVIKLCEDRDLAILKHSIPSHEFFQLDGATTKPSVQDETLALGYPSFGPGDGLNVRAGTISSLPVKSAIKKIEVSQNLAQGMSGGPLLNEDDEVIGVIHKGGPSEARDFAINIDVLNQWIAKDA